MVGILLVLSYWVDLFSEAMLVLGSVPFFVGNWMAGFRGFKLMEINVATAVFQVNSTV